MGLAARVDKVRGAKPSCGLWRDRRHRVGTSMLVTFVECFDFSAHLCSILVVPTTFWVWAPFLVRSDKGAASFT